MAKKPIDDFDAYERDLSARLNPTANSLSGIYARIRQSPKRVVFAEGEEERVIRATISFQTSGYGQAILIGREDTVKASMERLGLSGLDNLKSTMRDSHNIMLNTRKHSTKGFSGKGTFTGMFSEWLTKIEMCLVLLWLHTDMPTLWSLV